MKKMDFFDRYFMIMLTEEQKRRRKEGPIDCNFFTDKSDQIFTLFGPPRERKKKKSWL